MDSTLANNQPAPKKLGRAALQVAPPPSDSPLFWFGPQDSYWEWIRTNVARSPAVSNLISFPLSESSPIDHQSINSNVLAAIEGRLDPGLQQFLDWEITRQSTSGKDKTGTPTKRTKRAKDLDPTSGKNPGFHEQFRLILGDFWPGHRRTLPLPDPFVPFYWYELFDRILPWINRTCFQPLVEASSSGGGNGRSTPRVDQILATASASSDRLGHAVGLQGASVLVVCDTLTTASMWGELLGSQNILPTICHPSALQVRLKPDVVVLDIASSPRVELQKDWVDGPVVAPLCRLRSRYPDSLIVVTDGFPRWNTWKGYLSIGADILIPRPFQWFGVLWCLEHWLSSHRQVRI